MSSPLQSDAAIIGIPEGLDDGQWKQGDIPMPDDELPPPGKLTPAGEQFARDLDELFSTIVPPAR